MDLELKRFLDWVDSTAFATDEERVREWRERKGEDPNADVLAVAMRSDSAVVERRICGCD